jgi:carbon starvation protein
MKAFLLVACALSFFWVAYRFYAGWISKVFNENDSTPTPSVRINDNRDYIPTNPLILFGHHFATIAGAGPIIGPTVAVVFGYMPVWLWVVFGTVFIGAVQDYTTLFVSIREKGRSMAEVAHGTLGRLGFFLFIFFTIIMLLLVTSAFLGLTTVSLTSLVPLDSLRISEGGILKTIIKDGQEMAKIGGIASTSVIVLTFISPLIGFMLYIKQISVKIIVPFAAVVGILSIGIGLMFPLTIDPKAWMIILTIYVILASGLPVWLILQPRDFMNSFLLYIGMAILLVGVVGGIFSGVQFNAPAFNIAGGESQLGLIWPFLFITVACGAISGFHSLATGGTTAKQLKLESHAKKIGYGGMILESILAVLVIITITCGLDFNTEFIPIVFDKIAPNPILAFSLAMGKMLNNALGVPVAVGTVTGILMVEGFVITTLDTAVRLNRYLFEELWAILLKNPPRILKSYIFNSVLAAGLMLALCYTNTFKYLWPIFGATNQLLAALALIVVAVWLGVRRKPSLFALIPAGFMMVTTIAALWNLLFNQYLPNEKYILSAAAILMMALSVGVIALGMKSIMKLRMA